MKCSGSSFTQKNKKIRPFLRKKSNLFLISIFQDQILFFLKNAYHQSKKRKKYTNFLLELKVQKIIKVRGVIPETEIYQFFIRIKSTKYIINVKGIIPKTEIYPPPSPA